MNNSNLPPRKVNFQSIVSFLCKTLIFIIIFSVTENLEANTDSIVASYYNRALLLKENGNYDSAFIILEHAVLHTDSVFDKEAKTNLLDSLASLAFDCNKFEYAQQYFKQCIKAKLQLKKADLYVDYIGLSLTFLERGFPDSALYYINKGRYYWEQKNDTLISTSLENNTGRIYMDKGEFDSSLKHFLVALTNAQLKHDSVNLMYVNLNIGTLYQRMGKYDEALGSYLKSLAISQLINNTKGMALAYSIGIIYKERGDYQTALHYYTMAIPACKKLGELDDLANIYSNMSNVYMLMKRFDDATNILRKSIAVSDSAGNQRQLGIAYANMGKTKELMHQYDSATYYLNLSLDIFKKSGFLNLESIVLRMISEAYEARGDYKNAFNYHKKHTTIADSIHSEKVEKQIAELRLKYETENKETENNLLKKDIEFEKGKSYYLLVITIILLLSGIISLFLFYFIRKNTITKKQLAESEASRLKAKLESQKRELTLGALSVSRNLEFINSLIDELKELTNYVSEDGLQPLSNIVSKLTHQQSDNGWKEFEKRFSEIHSDFYSRLIIEYPDLTQNEVKLSAFLKLGMNTKEICSITFQSVRAVEAARLRLRKKLSLKNGENLSIFLQSY